jgi:small-conductance mechanosensitive channel
MAVMPLSAALFADLPSWADPLAQVALILVATVVAYVLLRTAARSAADHLVERQQPTGDGVLGDVELERRVRTLQQLATQVIAIVLAIIAALSILGAFQVNIGPAIAGLGVVGIAVGLGAQTLIKDWLSGIFVILENQYNIGDVVQIAGVSGVVEEFSLRRTTLRDLDGIVHSVPNGQISVASNMTRSWARVNLNVEVAYDTDIEKATRIINLIGQELYEDADWKAKMLEAPSLARVDVLGASGVELKVLGQVQPAQQWAVTGELRRRILARFAAEGIEIPFPHQVVVIRGMDPAAGGTSKGEAENVESQRDAADGGRRSRAVRTRKV